MTSTTDTTSTSPARLPTLSVTRLAANGLFRFLYPFLALVAADVALSDDRAGLLIGALAVGGMLTPIAVRGLARSGEAPRRLAVVGLVSLALGTVVLGGVAPWLVGVSPWLGRAVALLGCAVLGLAKPLLDVGTITYVSQRVPYGRRARATSTMELTWAGGLLVLAPTGALAAATSWRVALLALGAVTLALAVWLRRVLDDDPVRRRTDGPARRETDGMPGRTSVVVVLAMVVLIFTALELTFGVVGLWLERVRDVDPALLGVLTAVGAIGELAGSAFVLVAADRIGKARALAIGLVACTFGFGLLSTAEPLWLALVLLAIGLFGTETAIVAAIPLASEVAPGARSWFLSRMVAWASVARAVGGTAGPFLLLEVGLVANTSGSAIAALLALAALAWLRRREPRLTR